MWKRLVMFGLPLLLGNLLQQLYSSVDSVIVGRYVGKAALAAVGSTTSLVFLIVGFFQGISTGSNVVIAQAIGAGDHDKVRRSIASSILLSIVTGAVVGVVFFALTSALLRWTLVPEDIFDLTRQYLRVYMVGLPATALYNTGTAILRSMGDSRRPLYFLMFSSIVNTILDLWFVIGLGWGVAGAAWATVISQTLAALLVLYVVMAHTGHYALERRELRMDWIAGRAILLIGFPAAIQSCAVSLVNVLFQSQVNIFGSTVVAGYSAGIRISFFACMPCVAFGLAATTFVGQSVGAGNYARVRECARVCTIMSVGITILLGAASYIFRTPLLRAFTTDPEALYYGELSLLLIGVPYFLWSFPQIFGCVLTGMGRSMLAMIITLAGMGGVRLVWIFAMLPHWYDVRTVFVSFPISWTTAGIAMVIAYLLAIRKAEQTQAAQAALRAESPPEEAASAKNETI